MLTQAQAEQAWRARLAGAPRLLETNAQLFATATGLDLRAAGAAPLQLGIFPALQAGLRAEPSLAAQPNDGVFQRFTAPLPAAPCTAAAAPLRPALPVPPVVIGGPANAAVEPAPPTFGAAAAWRITVSPNCLATLSDAYLTIAWQGDAARLFSGTTLLDDSFYNGQPWTIGLKRFANLLHAGFTLSVLPLRQDAPIYLAPGARPALPPGGQTAHLNALQIVPEHALRILGAPAP